MVIPKISIITISYNAEAFIEKTILSVIKQTYPNIEYIIIDGASSDNTLKIIENYKNKISLIISEKDSGIYDAMNKGLGLAHGEWINFMNAGDEFTSDNIITDIFSKTIDSNIHFMYSDYYSKDPNNILVKRETSFNKGIINHQSCIYRKNLHNVHGKYIVTDKLIISDYLFFIRIPIINIKKIDKVIAIYDTSGISNNGNWTTKQRICADVAYGRRTFKDMLTYHIFGIIKSIFPKSVKEKIKKIISIKNCLILL